MKNYLLKQAFTLVELSIVLVILGLLVGGVLTGQALIRAAELRSVSRDFQKYHAAMMTFRDKYFYIPGDLPNATQFWGAADAEDGLDTGAACTTVVSTTPTTCNGDGDGTLFASTEGRRSWQHLANAGLIEGQYTGAVDTVAGFSPTYYTRGVNVPVSRLGNGAFAISNMPGPANVKFGVGGSGYNGLYILHMLPLAASGGGGPTVRPFSGAMKHEDAWNIDTKMDDGVSGSGRIRADLVKNTGNIVLTDMTCLTYDMTNTTNTCTVGFIFGN